MNAKHPCFNIEAKGKYGRVHLPVAPKCNIQCNYCNRSYDCVNESRPGVTSSILTPIQAIDYLKVLTAKHPNIVVAGIAGPGDPFATPDETMQTLRLMKKELPQMIACLSSNGLNIAPYIDELADLGVDHVTITINGIDTDVTEPVYSWVRNGKQIFRGKQGADLLLQKQLEAVRLLKEKGITVKINTIVMPGLNDDHIPEIAKKVGEMGADTMNLIPLYPVKDTIFENEEEPSKILMKNLRKPIANFIKPMTHCARCRADAAGLLGQDIEEAKQMIRDFALKPGKQGNRKYVAVASYEGMLVNQHLGEAESFYIFSETKSGYKMINRRTAPNKGDGAKRWMQMSDILFDCRALLVGGAGTTPYQYLSKSGLEIIEMTGLIDDGLDAVFKGRELKTIRKRDAFECGSECVGTGTGCG